MIFFLSGNKLNNSVQSELFSGLQVVLENSSRADEHDCPFVQASIYLTKILCDTLKIGEPRTEIS